MIKMDTNPAKRRKVDHHKSRGPVADGSAALDAVAQAGTPRSSTFVLQTQELLREVRLDYNKTFAGADELLHRIKSTLEATKAHDPTPVSPPGRPASWPTTDLILFADTPGLQEPRKETWSGRALSRASAAPRLALQGLVRSSGPVQCCRELRLQDNGQVAKQSCHRHDC